MEEQKKRGGKLETLWQLIKFGLVGVSNTIVSYAVNAVCYLVLDINEYVAALLGFVISVLNAYFWQSRFVFRESEEGEHRVWWQVLIKTYISYAFSGLLLTELLLFLWIKVLDIGQYMTPLADWLADYGIHMTPKDVAVMLAPFINMVITIPINFCINKFWAYRQRSSSEEK